MVSSCAFYGCTNRKTPGSELKFYSFPKVKGLNVKHKELLKRRRTAWYRAIRRKDITESDLDTRYVCSQHFSSGKPALIEDIEHPDWIPSVNVRAKRCDSSSLPLNRYSRAKNRLLKKKRVEIPSAENGNSFTSATVNECSDSNLENDTYDITANVANEAETNSTTIMIDAEAQTDLRGNIFEELQRRTTECLKLRAVVDELLLKENAFSNNDKKVKFFTGLSNFKTLQIILHKVDCALSEIRVPSLDNFQKLLLTLLKLRNNATFKELAYRFQVHRPETVSTVFQRVIMVLNHTFENLIHWPDRESLRKLVPKCFEERFGAKVAVIIDCFEIATERPSTVKARNQTFSNYKQKHTAKYLIGITPQGVISFISKGYGGRVSDKVITEECGIIDKLVPGDIVLADRGFTVQEILGIHQIKLMCPAFKGTKSQIHPVEVEKSRDISAVRIHVERIIGELRQKYQILNGPIPITILNKKIDGISLIDCIVRVACVMTNLCEPIVPL